MKVWTSGEVERDVADAYRDARKDVEQLFNKELTDHSYGNSIDRLVFIGILLSGDNSDYPEISRYHERERKAEFRLGVDHDRFRSANPSEQRLLVAESLLRAIRMIPSLGVKGFDDKALERDFLSALQRKGWV